jgi:hypothetical protein
VAHSLATSPSTSSRVLGLVGVLGGAVLLAAFVVDIAPDLNVFRLVLFNAGAMAIVLAVHRRQASAAPKLALLAAVLAFVTNVWYLSMVLLAVGRSQSPLGDSDFGLVWFFAGVAMWLTDAAFGLVALRLGLVSRWGALALTIGSLLAITGIDRLGLTSSTNPTTFGPLSQVGIVLNGIGWILLGLDVAIRRRLLPTQPQGVPPGA